MVRLSGYMIMGFLSMTIAQLIEAIYLGIVGTTELAAIAFTSPLVMSLMAAARGIGIGASSVIARAYGRGDRARAAVLTTHCLLLVAAFAALCVAIGVPGAHAFFVLLGAQDRVLELADAYIAVWLFGFMFFGVSMVGTHLLRAVGNAAMPGLVMTIGSSLQVVIGPFLIFGWAGLPALGIVGAAWAFVTARLVGFVLCMFWVAVKRTPAGRAPARDRRFGARNSARGTAGDGVESRRAAVDGHRDATARRFGARRDRGIFGRVAHRGRHLDGRDGGGRFGRPVHRAELGRASVRSRSHGAEVVQWLLPRLGWRVVPRHARSGALAGRARPGVPTRHLAVTAIRQIDSAYSRVDYRTTRSTSDKCNQSRLASSASKNRRSQPLS